MFGGKLRIFRYAVQYRYVDIFGGDGSKKPYYVPYAKVQRLFSAKLVKQRTFVHI
jgi:hypothetical protein